MAYLGSAYIKIALISLDNRQIRISELVPSIGSSITPMINDFTPFFLPYIL